MMTLKGRFVAFRVPDDERLNWRTDLFDPSAISVYHPYRARVPPLDCTTLDTNLSIIY